LQKILVEVAVGFLGMAKFARQGNEDNDFLPIKPGRPTPAAGTFFKSAQSRRVFPKQLFLSYFAFGERFCALAICNAIHGLLPT
jgi:hypothetical protein